MCAGLLTLVATGVVESAFNFAHATALLTGTIGSLIAGYVVALICKRAQVTHVLVLMALIAGISILSHFSQVAHADWTSLAVGSLESAICLTWGALFRKWQISKSSRDGQKEKPSLTRSVFAISVGFFVFMFYGVISGAYRGEDFWEINEEVVLLGVLVTNLLAGYLTAYISRQAPLSHIFVTSVLCLMTPVVFHECSLGFTVIGEFGSSVLWFWSFA